MPIFSESHSLFRRRPLIAVLCPLALCALVFAAPAHADLFAAKTVVDGPSPDLVSLGNVAMSRDDAGGLVYVKGVAGVGHVFASVLSGGVWRAPQELDAGLAGPSSQPAIAAADNGRLAAVFISNGGLYASVRAAGAAAFSPPQALAGAASNPALGMSVNGTAYASFTSVASGVANVYAARMDRTSTTFQAFAPPLDLDPTHSGGNTPAARSRVAVATDGTALVTWAEDGADGHTHAIARRVSGQGISVALADLTLASLDGRPGGSADSPQASLQHASDFGWVVFRQTFMDGAAPVSRVVARRELGSVFDPPVKLDPLSFPTADGADHPQVQIEGTGNGVAVTGLTASHQTFMDPLHDPHLGTPERLDGALNTLPPLPVIGLGSVDDAGAVAWQQSVGPADPPAIHARAFDGSGFGLEAVISQAAFGPADAPDGLSAAADRVGNVLVAFVQGNPGARRIVVGGLANQPTDFNITSPSRAATRSRPLIVWQPSSSALGLSGYRVVVDGRRVGLTIATRLRLRSPLSNGVHRVTVVAIDHYGQTTAAPTQRLSVGAGRPSRGGARRHR